MLRKLTAIRLAAFFNDTFNIGKLGKKKSNSVIATIVVFLMLGFCFASLSFSMSMLMAKPIIAMGFGSVYFTLFHIVAFSLVFMFSVFETKNVLFDCKDNDLMLSMPILARDIVLSRISTVLIINYAAYLVFILPAIAVFGYYGGGARGVIGASLVSLVIPVLATALASVIGYFVAKLAKKFRNNSAMTVIFSLLFVVAYFAILGRFTDSMTQLELNPDEFISKMAGLFNPILIVGRASMLEGVSFALFMVFSLVCILGIFFAIIRNYVAIITESDSSVKIKYVKSEMKQSSAVGSLVKKEFLKLFSSPTYLLNGSIGAIMQVVFAIFAAVKSSEIISALPIISDLAGVDIEPLVPFVLAGALTFIGATIMISVSSLSLEGNNLWILQTLPVSVKEVIASKLIPHLTISIPASVISSVCLCIGIRARAFEWVIITAIPLLYAILSGVYGLLLNIAFPKFDFDNEAQVVKQSMAVTINMFGGMIISAATVALGAFCAFKLGAAAAIVIMICVFACLISAAIAVLVIPARRKLERLLNGR